MDEELEQKIKAIEQKIPGMNKLLREKNELYDAVNKTYVEDVTYTETEMHQLAGAKWEHQRRPGGFGFRTQCTGWVTLYWRKKASEEIKQEESRDIVTRHPHELAFDRIDLWEYKWVQVTPFGKDRIEIAWANVNGEKGPKHYVTIK